ncbi:Mitochondrial uncoupling protein 4 [Glycine max]|nr:hypothetical protein JHK85_015175 [Glycine max]KAH1245121.1 Mitochondrial uncoupling protein 4 [Glycine max]
MKGAIGTSRLHHPPTRPHQSPNATSTNPHSPPSLFHLSRSQPNAAASVLRPRLRRPPHRPVGEPRRNYNGVFDAIRRMSNQEVVGSLWRGSVLTVNRAMIVTASQLASYDQFKETILGRGLMEDGLGTHVAASFAAGFVASVASNPIDVIKTRVMNMNAEAYNGALDCALKTVRAEGPLALYKGFIPTISRQGPFTVVLFVTLEQVRKLLKDF